MKYFLILTYPFIWNTENYWKTNLFTALQVVRRRVQSWMPVPSQISVRVQSWMPSRKCMHWVITRSLSTTISTTDLFVRPNQAIIIVFDNLIWITIWRQNTNMHIQDLHGWDGVEPEGTDSIQMPSYWPCSWLTTLCTREKNCSWGYKVKVFFI